MMIVLSAQSSFEIMKKLCGKRALTPFTRSRCYKWTNESLLQNVFDKHSKKYIDKILNPS